MTLGSWSGTISHSFRKLQFISSSILSSLRITLLWTKPPSHLTLVYEIKKRQCIIVSMTHYLYLLSFPGVRSFECSSLTDNSVPPEPLHKIRIRNLDRWNDPCVFVLLSLRFLLPRSFCFPVFWGYRHTPRQYNSESAPPALLAEFHWLSDSASLPPKQFSVRISKGYTITYLFTA